MDEASKQELRKAWPGFMADCEATLERFEPIIDRLIAEAEGRVHAQAIAAGVALVDENTGPTGGWLCSPKKLGNALNDMSQVRAELRAREGKTK